MIDLLIEASKLLADEMSPEEVLKSNLLGAWLQQVSSALSAVDMVEELDLWEQTRQVEVNVSTAAELRIYMMSMRAVLLGILHQIETDN
jgi:hypothetical protein